MYVTVTFCFFFGDNNKNVKISVSRESVSSVMPAVLSTAVSGLTGSNPVSRIIFSYFILIITFGLLLIFIPKFNPIMYSNQAYFHINPPPVLVLSFKCTEIDTIIDIVIIVIFIE